MSHDAFYALYVLHIHDAGDSIADRGAQIKLILIKTLKKSQLDFQLETFRLASTTSRGLRAFNWRVLVIPASRDRVGNVNSLLAWPSRQQIVISPAFA